MDPIFDTQIEEVASPQVLIGNVLMRPFKPEPVDHALERVHVVAKQVSTVEFAGLIQVVYIRIGQNVVVVDHVYVVDRLNLGLECGVYFADMSDDVC